MNILDKIDSILNMSDTYISFMPDEPDNCIGLFCYSSDPEHSFSSLNYIDSIQVRVRNKIDSGAFQKALAIQEILKSYSDSEVDILQNTGILDIGFDEKNPPRKEYTVNFKVIRK